MYYGKSNLGFWRPFGGPEIERGSVADQSVQLGIIDALAGLSGGREHEIADIRVRRLDPVARAGYVIAPARFDPKCGRIESVIYQNRVPNASGRTCL